MHRATDPFGDLQRDLDEEEVWFDAEALAAASRVDLGADLAAVDPLGRAPDLERLASAIATPGISLARLPGWPDAGPAGQGLGPVADELIGELRPGDLVVLAGSQRGVGRTSLLAQLGDGLALADAATPVLFVSSEPPALWRARTLARFFGVDARTFVDRERARREPRFAAMLTEFAGGPWAEIDARQRFVPPEALAAGERRASTIAGLRRWHAERSGGAWPIVILDAVEHLGELTRTLAELAELAADEGLIVLASGDLGDDDHARARAIDRVASVRLRATAGELDDLILEPCHRRLGPRGTGRSSWHRPTGRFGPLR